MISNLDKITAKPFRNDFSNSLTCVGPCKINNFITQPSFYLHITQPFIYPIGHRILMQAALQTANRKCNKLIEIIGINLNKRNNEKNFT